MCLSYCFIQSFPYFSLPIYVNKIFTSHNGNSLLKKFKGAFEHIVNIYAFHAVMGYFRALGYYAIREHLLKVPEMKILVGINVDVIGAEAKRRRCRCVQCTTIAFLNY